MSDARPDLAGALGAAAAGVGVLVTMTGRTKLALLGSVAAGAAAALNTLDGKTDTEIDAGNITTLSGAAADLNTAYDSAGILSLIHI